MLELIRISHTYITISAGEKDRCTKKSYLELANEKKI